MSRVPGTAALLALMLGLAGVVPAWSGETIPDDLVVDLRVYEARSSRPDFQVMESLAFFVDTDGADVSEQQWLATIARKIPDSFLATLARETVKAEGPRARFELRRRSRSFGLALDLENFLQKGTFQVKARGDFSRSGESLRTFERPIELRLGHTYVWASRELEVTGGEYLAHFRDFDDADHRSELYQSLRDYTIFLVLAVTPRLATPVDGVALVDVPLGENLLPELESPLGVRIVGQIVLELGVDGGGAPLQVFVLRSSIPELNPRILGAASGFRFPDAAGRRARVTLDLSANPR